jgi:hypothetical protein
MAQDGTLTSSEVISQEAVRAETLEAVEEELVFRQAFDEYDATDINSDAVQIPVAQGTVPETETVSEGSSVANREEELTSKVTVNTSKYMAEAAITREAIEDSILGEIERQVNAHQESLMESLDGSAYDELSGGITRAAVGPDTPTGTMNYANAIDAMTALEGDGYEPDLLIVSAQSKGDLMKDDKFTRASDMGDEVVFNGVFGEVAGIQVAVSNVGDLGAGEGFMVDTDHFGVEVVRSDIATREYEEESEDQVVVQIRTRRGFKALRGDAAAKIEA